MIWDRRGKSILSSSVFRIENILKFFDYIIQSATITYLPTMVLHNRTRVRASEAAEESDEGYTNEHDDN